MEFFGGDTGFGGAGGAEVGGDFFGGEFALEGDEDAPLEVGEVDDAGFDDVGGLVGFGAGLEPAAADVAYAEDEEALGGHELEVLGAGAVAEVSAVGVHGETLGDFEG